MSILASLLGSLDDTGICLDGVDVLNRSVMLIHTPQYPVTIEEEMDGICNEMGVEGESCNKRAVRMDHK